MRQATVRVSHELLVAALFPAGTRIVLSAHRDGFVDFVVEHRDLPDTDGLPEAYVEHKTATRRFVNP